MAIFGRLQTVKLHMLPGKSKKNSKSSSTLKLQKGDVAIFYPEDIYIPCVEINDSLKVVKAVVKVAL